MQYWVNGVYMYAYLCSRWCYMLWWRVLWLSCCFVLCCICQREGALSQRLQAMHLADDREMSASSSYVFRGNCSQRSSIVSARPSKPRYVIVHNFFKCVIYWVYSYNLLSSVTSCGIVQFCTMTTRMLTIIIVIILL